MIMNIPIIANLGTMRNRRQHIIDENLRRQNSKQIHHHYMVGDKINAKTIDPVKLSEQLHGDHSLLSKPTPTER